MSVSKSEIINEIASNFPNIYKKDINKLFDIFTFEIVKALSNQERVELRDVMMFETRLQKKRVALNPKTLNPLKNWKLISNDSKNVQVRHEIIKYLKLNFSIFTKKLVNKKRKK